MAVLTWSELIKLGTLSLIMMFAGSHVVHSYYKPLDDLDELVEKELQRRRTEQNVTS